LAIVFVINVREARKLGREIKYWESLLYAPKEPLRRRLSQWIHWKRVWLERYYYKIYRHLKWTINKNKR
jgi:hypothetical protein